MSPADFIVNAVAVVFLAGMAFVPIVNLVVGVVVGFSVAGPLGAFVGPLFAMLITAVEIGMLRITERRPVHATVAGMHAPNSTYRAIINLADWRGAKEAATGAASAGKRMRGAMPRKPRQRVAA